MEGLVHLYFPDNPLHLRQSSLCCSTAGFKEQSQEGNGLGKRFYGLLITHLTMYWVTFFALMLMTQTAKNRNPNRLFMSQQ